MRNEMIGLGNDENPSELQGVNIDGSYPTPSVEPLPLAEESQDKSVEPALQGAVSAIAFSYPSAQALKSPSARQYVSEVLGQLNNEGLSISRTGLYQAVANLRITGR